MPARPLLTTRLTDLVELVTHALSTVAGERWSEEDVANCGFYKVRIMVNTCVDCCCHEMRKLAVVFVCASLVLSRLRVL